MKHPDRARTRQTFSLSGVENRADSNGNKRVVCFVYGDAGLLAVWGTVGVNTRHVDALDLAFEGPRPVKIECDWIQPSDWARGYKHAYWVFEDDYFQILS